MKKAKGVPEGERTIVLRQMKVRTALKGDFSWINNKNTDEEDEEEEGLARDVPVKASYSNGVSSAPSDSSSTSESSPTSQKPSPLGYIIRGVFTKTNDTTQASPTSASSYGYSESVRSSNTSTPQYSPLNKKSSEHYKKIAPHSVRSKAVSPAPEEPPSSTEERTKRTEAASSVIKSSASKERSYVLSAVNKYGRSEKLDSPSKDPSFSFVAKRVEINDEEPEEDSDTSPQIAPKSSLNPVLTQKPTPAPRKLGPSTETKTQTTITIKETAKEPPKTPFLTETKTMSTETKTQTTVTKKETVFDTPKNTFSTESKSPSTETKTQTTVTKETVFDIPKNPISTESKTKSSQDTKSLWDKWDKPAATETTITTVTEKSSQGTKSAWDKWDVPAATEITTTTITEKSSQDTKSLRDKWDLPAATETTTTTVTEKSSQDTKSLWDKWDKPAATETAITTVTEKSPSTETKTQTTITIKETAKEPPKTPFLTETKTKSPSTETKTQTTVTKKETVFDTPENTFSTESKSPSTETKTQTTVTKETVFDIPKNPISTESKTKSSRTETITQTTMTKKETVSETPKPLTEPETKSSQDTKSLWDKCDLSVPTETTTTTVTEKSSQDTKSLWDKWDKPAATETAITTVTEKSSHDTKSAWDKWDVPAATEITTTTITEKSSQDTKSLWDKWDKPAATETAITTVTEQSSQGTKSAWDKWDVPAATEITTTTITEKREADIVIPTWGVMDTTKNMSVSTQHQSPSTEIQTQTTVTKKETVFETEPVTKSAFKIAKETKQDPPTASDLISFGMEENSTVTTIHTTKYQTEDPVHKTFDSSGLTNITTDTTTHWSETPDPEHKKLVMVKEYVNSTGFNPSEYSSINKYDDITYSRSNYSYSSPSAMYRSPGTSCTYCGEMVGDDARITIEHLNIYSHPSCFKCGVCSKPMGELLESMYIHSGQVHCDSCYDKVF
ncbi:zinc finger protein 185-like isoform X3 [Acipenser ruthenus]|uniref:zinc finger protein 185-like isoform X3 n=1 Tax=Acipenser ruthenus TaxID=7906 RepID=UPI00274174C8|nr:zinc finger protein 185-like isoform X3 [Acipenser ruthenus]